MDRKSSEVRRQLKALCDVVYQAIAAIDIEMKKPSDVERGKRIAKIMNILEIQYDSARYFGLGESLKSDKRSQKWNQTDPS